MDCKHRITTVTADGRVFSQTAENMIGWCNRTRHRLLQTQTAYEDIVYSKISPRRKQYAVRQQRLELNGHLYFADIYISRWKIIIEVDGGYHTTEEKKQADKFRDSLCSEYCIRVFRITNEQVLDEEYLLGFMKAINSASLPKHINLSDEEGMKYIANKDFAKNGLFKKEPRMHVICPDGKTNTNSLKYLCKKEAKRYSKSKRHGYERD